MKDKTTLAIRKKTKLDFDKVKWDMQKIECRNYTHDECLVRLIGLYNENQDEGVLKEE